MNGKVRPLFLAVAGAAALISAGALAQSAGSSAIVNTDKGKIQGYVRNDALEFRGIPFAKPVGGDRRWTMPEAVERWDGVFQAMNFKAPCAQSARYNLTERSDNEDCLAINVTVPNAAFQQENKKRPVLVWIHGGGFVGGSSSLYRLDTLAKALDAVVVTMNYRVGLFGFMPHPVFDPDCNGGFALEDQRLAMRWVQKNIAAFGGDPNNITLAGESAGAASVCMHVIAPDETAGLFHKAIIQSGACVHKLRNATERNSFGIAGAKKVGCNKDPAAVLSCLRTKDAQELIKAADDAGAGDLMALAPVMGTRTLPRTGQEALRDGKFVKVPVLNGGALDELRLYVGYAVQEGNEITAGNLRKWLSLYYGDKADAVAAQYPLTNGKPAELLGSVWTDFRPDIGINHCLYVETAKLMSAAGVEVYQWEFADRNAPALGIAIPALPDPGFDLGAAHSTELNYYFPGYSNTTQLSAPDLTEGQKKLAAKMVGTWKSFVNTGKATAPGVEWTPYKADTPRAIRFDQSKVEAFDPVAAYKCTFWQSLYPEYFSR